MSGLYIMIFIGPLGHVVEGMCDIKDNPPETWVSNEFGELKS
jgi:hypothetical protein